MPNWDGIEDATVKPPRVWLSRAKETENWKPLRRVDCWALNESKDPVVIVDGGRMTANKEKGTLVSNFHRSADRTLVSAVWFLRKEKNSDDKESNLIPIISDEDTEKMESLYQAAIQATSSYGAGIDEILKQEKELEDGSKVKVMKVQGGSVLCIKKVPPGWFSSGQDLQRGYGAYTVEGEDAELSLGPVKHLYFVVHGIGEAIWSREDVAMTGIIDDVAKVRTSMQKKQIESWKKKCEQNKKEGLPVPLMPGRIEFIPIEWFDRIHSSSNALSRSLKAITIPTIPALRGIANEAVFDVLMYLTPKFCGQVLDCVTTQITNSYNKFMEIHPDFLKNGGKCSLIGHSLGSVICWDLLSILKASVEPPPKPVFGDHLGTKRESSGVAIASSPDTVDVGYQAYASDEHADNASNGTWGPTLPREMNETLPFVPENVVFLGSPLGMFLTLRGAHPVFDQLRKENWREILKEFEAGEESATGTEIVVRDNNNKEGKNVDIKSERLPPELPFASTFTLPVTGGVYNIFHPSDPVAYRIEPLLLPPDLDEKEIPPPIHLTVEGEGLRFHLKAQEISGQLGNLLTSLTSKLGQSQTELSVRPRGMALHSTGPKVFPLGGKSQRVDFQLQRNVVDPEYLSAVTAHSTYFVNTDVQDFVMNLAAKAAVADKEETTTTMVAITTTSEIPKVPEALAGDC